MRSFTFEVIVAEHANGKVTKATQGGPWLQMAKKWPGLVQLDSQCKVAALWATADRVMLDIPG